MANEFKDYHKLSDGWETLEAHVNLGNDQLERINEFIKKQADIELAYSRAISKLVKGYREDIARKVNDKNVASATCNQAFFSNTLMQAWQSALDQVEAVSTSHGDIAQRLEQDIRKTFKYQAKDNEKRNALAFDEIRKARSEWRKALELLERNRSKYERAWEEAETAQANYQNSLMDLTRKDSDKLCGIAEKKKLQATEAMEVYRQCVADTNARKRVHFSEIMPRLIENIVKDDHLNRGTYAKEHLDMYTKVFTMELKLITKSFELQAEAVTKVLPEQDTADLLASLARTEIPPDIVFVAKESASSPKVATALPPSPVGAALPAKPSTADLSPQPKGDEALMALPLSEALVAVRERKQKLAVELGQVEKKAQNVQKMSTDTLGPTLYDVKEVSDVLRDKATSMRRRIQVLEEFLACNDPDAVPSALDFALEESPATATPPPHYATHGHGAASSAAGSTPALDTTPKDVAVAAYDFNGNPESGELSCKAGDKFTILLRETDGWWKVRTASGEEGYIPGNYTDAGEAQ